MAGGVDQGDGFVAAVDPGGVGQRGQDDHVAGGVRAGPGVRPGWCGVRGDDELLGPHGQLDDVPGGGDDVVQLFAVEESVRQDLLMARREVRFQPDGRDEAGPAVPRSVPRWWRGPDPDPAVVGRLYVQDGRTETEIAVLLSISRARVAAVLRDAGIPRRDSRKDCPIDRRHPPRAWSRPAARRPRWPGSTGCPRRRRRDGSPRPACSAPTRRSITRLLRELYVDRQLTTREVAAELGISKARVIRALTAAGIPRRPRSVRPPRGARAAVTDTALTEVYHRQGMTIAEAATHFGVSDEYLRRRIAEAGLTRRPGTFAPRTAWSPRRVAGQGGEAVRDGDDHAGGRRPARGVQLDRQQGAARRQGSGATRRRGPTGSAGHTANVDQ